jgi:hypothetical protein
MRRCSERFEDLSARPGWPTCDDNVACRRLATDPGDDGVSVLKRLDPAAGPSEPLGQPGLSSLSLLNERTGVLCQFIAIVHQTLGGRVDLGQLRLDGRAFACYGCLGS